MFGRGEVVVGKAGPGEVARHRVRVFQRGQTRGLFIAYPAFTDAGVVMCRESLQHAVFVLAELGEFIPVSDVTLDRKDFLKQKAGLMLRGT